MLIHFHKPEEWLHLNQQVESHFHLNAHSSKAKVYQGLHHALVEIVFGLARQFPFKKYVFYQKGHDPFVDQAAGSLMRCGVKVQAYSKEELQDFENFKERFNKETLLVLHTEDDPLLGLLFNSKKLENYLFESKIFSLKVSH
ncbi:MAG: hypothetical protein KDD22_02065, partial [Bdellovibrionales bacterium]|nr:hypothetical protein [Bdellovibrionales bacterium]